MDGVSDSATCGVGVRQKTVFVCDTGNAALRMVTSARAMKGFLEAFGKFAQVFGLHLPTQKVTVAHSTRSAAEGELRKVVNFIDNWEKSLSTRSGRSLASLQGPYGIISGQMRQGIRISLQSVSRLEVLLKHPAFSLQHQTDVR